MARHTNTCPVTQPQLPVRGSGIEQPDLVSYTPPWRRGSCQFTETGFMLLLWIYLWENHFSQGMMSFLCGEVVGTHTGSICNASSCDNAQRWWKTLGSFQAVLSKATTLNSSRQKTLCSSPTPYSSETNPQHSSWQAKHTAEYCEWKGVTLCVQKEQPPCIYEMQLLSQEMEEGGGKATNCTGCS